MPAGPHREERAVATELAGLAEAIGKRPRVVPDEVLVAEDVEDERQIRDRDDPGGLGPAPVVVAIRAIQRDREEAPGLPLKGVPVARRRFDACASAAGENVHDLFVQVSLRRGPSSGRDLDDLHVDEVASTGEMRERALRFQSWPRRDVELEEIEPESLVDRDRLLTDPLLIRIDQEAWLGAQRATVSRAACGARM